MGSAYTLMTFLTSVLFGLVHGLRARCFPSIRGAEIEPALRSGHCARASVLILSAHALLINAAVYAFLTADSGLSARSGGGVGRHAGRICSIIFAGLLATSIYNYLSCLLRALGNSTVPLLFLAVSALLNVALDLLFVLGLHWGIAGAAWATVIAQYISAAGLSLYVLAKCKEWLPKRADLRYNRGVMREILSLSWLTCAQQSVMNFGILMVQGLVNSFGADGDGGLCRGGEDRHLRLYARAGFRQRLFHLRRPELRRGGAQSASATGTQAGVRCQRGRSALAVSGAGVRARRAADGACS